MASRRVLMGFESRYRCGLLLLLLSTEVQLDPTPYHACERQALPTGHGEQLISTSPLTDAR